MLKHYETNKLDQRMRHIPADEPAPRFNMTFLCWACDEVHTLTFQGHDANAAMWGEPVLLPCGATLTIHKPIG